MRYDPDLASNADRMLLLNNGKTEASDIRSAWGLDAEEAPVADPSEEETAADAPHNGDAVEDGEAETDGATADSARENGGEEE